jgi:spoIIIJ-associated protein
MTASTILQTSQGGETDVNDSAELQTIDQVADEALRHFQEIIRLGNLDAVAQIISVEGDTITLDANGPDAGLLIGRRGQTLHALQYLMLVMLTHVESGSHKFRLVLDADGYRKRRTEALQQLAHALALQVKQTGEEAVLEPLNAMERRIVHTALVDDPDVETYSEGEGADRHIVITARRD